MSIERKWEKYSSSGKPSTSGQTQKELGLRVIFLLLQIAELSGSNAGNDSVEPASGFVIKNCQTSCSMWCPTYGAR